MFRGDWIIVNNVPSYVNTWGCWIDDKIEADSILVLIAGNPGVTDFYFTFLSKLQPLIKMPIWTISHAGNMIPPKTLDLPPLDQNPELYNLNGQIEHKRAFIKKYIPSSKKIYLIGHSVGAKICAELMKDEDIASRTEQVHLIFPTLQHIKDTPNGRVFTNISQYAIPVLVALAWLFNCFPGKFRYCLLSIYFWIRRYSPADKHCIEGALKFFTPTAVKASLFLATDEMDKIKDLDSEVYRNQGGKITCYYGTNDRWAPLSQFDDIVRKHPEVNCRLLEEKFTHAFVLKTSNEMADFLYKEISCG